MKTIKLFVLFGITAAILLIGNTTWAQTNKKTTDEAKCKIKTEKTIDYGNDDHLNGH